MPATSAKLRRDRLEGVREAASRRSRSAPRAGAPARPGCARGRRAGWRARRGAPSRASYSSFASGFTRPSSSRRARSRSARSASASRSSPSAGVGPGGLEPPPGFRRGRLDLSPLDVQRRRALGRFCERPSELRLRRAEVPQLGGQLLGAGTARVGLRHQRRLEASRGIVLERRAEALGQPRRALAGGPGRGGPRHARAPPARATRLRASRRQRWARRHEAARAAAWRASSSRSAPPDQAREELGLARNAAAAGREPPRAPLPPAPPRLRVAPPPSPPPRPARPARSASAASALAPGLELEQQRLGRLAGVPQFAALGVVAVAFRGDGGARGLQQQPRAAPRRPSAGAARPARRA